MFFLAKNNTFLVHRSMLRPCSIQLQIQVLNKINKHSLTLSSLDLGLVCSNSSLFCLFLLDIHSFPSAWRFPPTPSWTFGFLIRLLVLNYFCYVSHLSHLSCLSHRVTNLIRLIHDYQMACLHECQVVNM